ncbi:MAG: 7-cyano-7-deazaguanine synthase QueC [Deltaproteobacteria bacterium]|nr:7-cyano-7-deazaguanine synthase QueC [Deltaproteobacteria bacterium]
MKEKVVVIASGGIDSSTLLFKTVNENYKTYALTFMYGQKHRREIDTAKWICEQLKVSHKILDLSVLKDVLSGSALTDSSISIPEVPAEVLHYDTLKTTIVPNRNSIFLSIAIGYAVSIGANQVFFGAHHSDRGVYPDCRIEFVEAFQSAERLAVDNASLTIKAPFAHMEKSEIVRLGTELGVPYQLTWSCYKGGDLHCGVCSSCRERKRAFTQSGVSDPTRYER